MMRSPETDRRGLAIVATLAAALAFGVLVGCDSRPDTSPNPPAPTPGVDRVVSAATDRACYATHRAAGSDTLRNDTTRRDIRGLALSAGVDQRVRDAIVNGLYARDTTPVDRATAVRMYQLVRSACERAGWQQPR